MRRLGSEEGTALVTAILVTFLVLTLGVSAAATVDVQQKQSRKQRERESTFQLAEAVLNTQVYQLSRRWPGAPGTGTSGEYPVSCTQTSTSAQSDCPGSAAVISGYRGADYTQVSWVTTVRDNGGSLEKFYDAALAETQPRWDANGDHMLWVRAEARLVDSVTPTRFKRRAVVALVRAESRNLRGLPVATLVVDHFETTNNGNKVIIDGNGESNEYLTSSGEIAVRCEAPGLGDPNLCAKYWRSEQIDPNRVTYRPNPPLSILSPEQLELLRERARIEGNYYAAGCAPSLAGDRPGEVVFIESAGGQCTYQADAVYNAPGTPGVVVVGTGSIESAERRPSTGSSITRTSATRPTYSCS